MLADYCWQCSGIKAAKRAKKKREITRTTSRLARRRATARNGAAATRCADVAYELSSPKWGRARTRHPTRPDPTRPIQSNQQSAVRTHPHAHGHRQRPAPPPRRGRGRLTAHGCCHHPESVSLPARAPGYKYPPPGGPRAPSIPADGLPFPFPCHSHPPPALAQRARPRLSALILLGNDEAHRSLAPAREFLISHLPFITLPLAP